MRIVFSAFSVFEFTLGFLLENYCIFKSVTLEIICVNCVILLHSWSNVVGNTIAPVAISKVPPDSKTVLFNSV